MNSRQITVAVASAAICVVGLFIHIPAIAVIGGIGIVVTFLASGMARTRERYENLPDAGLSLDAQAQMRPLIKAHKDLEAFATLHKNNEVLSVIAKEAISESNDILATSARLLKARSIALKTRVRSSTPIPEVVTDVDAQLKEARSAIETLYDRLVNYQSAGNELGPNPELRDSISRLQSLNVSLDEAEQLMKENQS